jgi:hypothetical protein
MPAVEDHMPLPLESGRVICKTAPEKKSTQHHNTGSTQIHTLIVGRIAANLEEWTTHLRALAL